VGGQQCVDNSEKREWRRKVNEFGIMQPCDGVCVVPPTFQPCVDALV